MKCLILLSYKSSGSSACQNLLARYPGIHHVSKTRHFEHETLYWTKAASVLRLPQQKMLDSEVPLSRGTARADIVTLLCENVKGFIPPPDDAELIFTGWRKLCQTFAPVFLEKSPHHLLQWSALELMRDSMERLPDVAFYFLGVVRNPMDTLYSVFRRWKTPPEQAQYEWLIAYRNLLKFRDMVGERLIILRYEEMIRSPQSLHPVCDALTIKRKCISEGYWYQPSQARWKTHPLYGFVLAEDVLRFAQNYGYTRDELIHSSNPLWPYYRDASRCLYRRLFLPVIRRAAECKRWGRGRG